MEEILDSKTQLLVALGAATAAKCQGCFAKLYGLAADAGVTASEIRAVVAIANTVSTKSGDFMGAFIEETTSGAVPRRKNGSESTPGGCICG